MKNKIKVLFFIAVFVFASQADAPRAFADNGYDDPLTFTVVNAPNPVEFSCTPSGTTGGFQLIPISAGLVAISGGNWDGNSGPTGADQTIINSSSLCTAQVINGGQYAYIDGLGDNKDYLIVNLGSALGGNQYAINWVWTVHYTDFVIGFDSAVPVSNSRFTITYPEDNAVENSPVTVGASWFISLDDIDKLSTGIFGVGAGSFRYVSQVCPLNTFPNTTQCYPAIDWTLPTGYETSSTTILSFSTTLPLRNNTDYKLVQSIVGSNYGNIFGAFMSIATTTYFTVGSTTHAGNVREDVEQAIENAQNATATSTDVYAIVNASCNPFSSGFDVALCIYSIISPPNDLLQQDIQQVKNQFLTLPPWGYVTRFFSILTSSATTTLPKIDYVFATSSPFYTYDIHLDPFATLASADSILNATSTSANPQTIWQIMEYIVNVIVYLMLAFMIIKDLTRVHDHDTINKNGGVGNKQYGPYK